MCCDMHMPPAQNNHLRASFLTISPQKAAPDHRSHHVHRLHRCIAEIYASALPYVKGTPPPQTCRPHASLHEVSVCKPCMMYGFVSLQHSATCASLDHPPSVNRSVRGSGCSDEPHFPPYPSHGDSKNSCCRIISFEFSATYAECSDPKFPHEFKGRINRQQLFKILHDVSMATVEQTNDTSQVNAWRAWTESKSSWRSSVYRDWEFKTGALLLLTLLLTYLVTSLISSIAIRRKKNGKEPPQMPYWVPFLGNLIPFL